jgi:thioredoxin-like negative regulator of GroEL
MGFLGNYRRAVAVALTSLMAGWAQAAGEVPVSWLTDTGAATAAASESGKPMLIDVWAIWCEPCKLMEATTYRDERVVRTIGDFVPLKVDADANEAFLERYEVVAFPTTLFLDGAGREITRLLSHVETDVLLEKMEQVRDGYASYVESVDRRGDPAALRVAADYLMRVGNAARACDLLRSAVKASAGEAAESIELDLAAALLADDRAGAASKVLKRLSTSATTQAVRGKALVALVRAERARGKTAKADEALALLREEFPDLVSAVGD